MITKGEWKITGVDKNYITSFDAQMVICKVSKTNLDNAHLIAAAPKTKRDRDALLAACNSAILWLHEEGPDIDAGQLEDVLKAAIAAANAETTQNKSSQNQP